MKSTEIAKMKFCINCKFCSRDVTKCMFGGQKLSEMPHTGNHCRFYTNLEKAMTAQESLLKSIGVKI
jgi:hypothetical protein